MPIVRSSKSTTILIVVTLLFSSGVTAADNNVVNVTAEITKGKCEFSTTTDSVEFSPQIASNFSSGNAAAVMPLKLQYQCEGYANNDELGIVILSSPSPDNQVLLSNASTATGVGFMLKNGEVTEKAGFYSAGTTLTHGSKFIVDTMAQGEHRLSVGFVKQNTATAIKPGDAKASVIFMFVMP